MFFHTLTIMVYSFIMYHIFYRLPLKHNLISFKKRGETEIMTGERLKITGSMANQDAHLHDLIQIDQEEQQFHKEKSDLREVEVSRDGSISFKPRGIANSPLSNRRLASVQDESGKFPDKLNINFTDKDNQSSAQSFQLSTAYDPKGSIGLVIKEGLGLQPSETSPRLNPSASTDRLKQKNFRVKSELRRSSIE